MDATKFKLHSFKDPIQALNTGWVTTKFPVRFRLMYTF